MFEFLFLMRLLFFILAVFAGMSCTHKMPPPPPPVIENFVDNSPCTFYNDYSAKERLSRKPFGQSAKIELVSFDSEYEVRLDSIVYKESRYEIPKRDSKIDRSQLREIITLSASQIDGLTNVLFNYDFGRAKNDNIEILIGSVPDVGCYKPRHAILFFRKKADVEPFAYFEICLECQGVRTFPKQYELGTFCSGKYDLLREYFRQTGIKYGLEVRY